MIKYFIFIISSVLLHPVHVSMSSMEYMPDENGFRITVRMYSDDLLLDILSLYELPEEYITDHVYTGPDDIYEDYINDRIEININGEKFRPELIEIEKLEIETIMRLFIKYEGEVRNVNISNTILTGIYMDQVNLFIYKDELNELAFRFTGEYSMESLELEKATVIP